MSANVQATHDVFISYSSHDKQQADAACSVLEGRRIRCWIAPRDIAPGTEWGASIIGGIDACRIMVLIFSSHANDSGQVRREVERAISKGLTVLPFRVEDVRPAGAMEYALSNTHWLDAFTPPVERQLDALAVSVQALLARSQDGAVSIPSSKMPLEQKLPIPKSFNPRGIVAIACFLSCLVLLLVAIERYQAMLQQVEAANRMLGSPAFSGVGMGGFPGFGKDGKIQPETPSVTVYCLGFAILFGIGGFACLASRKSGS